MDKLQVFTLFLLWQGGGAYITGGAEVTFTSCNIYENTANFVRAPRNMSIAPMDKNPRDSPWTEIHAIHSLLIGRVEVL